MAQLHTPPRPSRARTAALAAGLALLATCAPAQAEAEDPFMGALMPMAGSKPGSTCPNGWLPAEGQILPIQSYTALFSILGTAYGGNGTNNFALPDLRGRTAVGLGQGPGLSQLDWGEQGGSASATLIPQNLPLHSHGLATTAAATHAAPDPARTLAQGQNAGLYASSGTPFTLTPSGLAGQDVPVPTMSPYLAIIWCIATQGAFPQRP